MKKVFYLLSIIIFIVMLSGCNKMDKDSSKCVIYEKISGKDEYEVIGVKNEDIPREIVISSRYKGKPVTRIAESAFYSIYSRLDNVIYIELPNTIVEIGRKAFSCSNIMDINIPNSVKKIEYAAFEYCGNLEEIFIPSSVEDMGSSVFFYCSSLKKVTINANINEIPYNTFSGCPITEFNCISTIKEFGEGCFSPLRAETFIIPDSIEKIGNNCFSNSSVKKIIGGSKLKEIGKEAFSSCRFLNTLDLSKTKVENIVHGVLSETEYIKILNLPATLKTIADFNLYNCEKMETITVEAGNKNYRVENGILFSLDKSILYKYLPNKFDSVYTVPDSVREIRSYAFKNCDNLITLNLNKDLEKIQRLAVMQCKNLTTAHIYYQTEVVGVKDYFSSAFYNCEKLVIYVHGTGIPSYWSLSYGVKRVEVVG